jgi:hypothetical protein
VRTCILYAAYPHAATEKPQARPAGRCFID